MTRPLALGGMCPARDALPLARATDLLAADGRPLPAFRVQLRRIPSLRNALSLVSVYLQTGALLSLAVWSPWTWPGVFVLMGRAHAQFASLMHEAAHRLLFADKSFNDLVGRWLIGYPFFTSTDAYRRVHMAHHRQEFGPDEPDIPLYANYPITTASFRRKLWRDLTGRTGLTLLRAQLNGLRSPNPAARRAQRQLWAVQAVLLASSIVAGVWWLYLLFWFLPYMTVWRLINRLRSVAEHGGLMASKDRRITTHSVRQHLPARFMLVPFHIGWHLAHHVDSGVPFRNLPRYHRALFDAGYVDDQLEYPSYPALWRRLQLPAST